MKKILFCFILILCVAGTSLFAWDPSYLTTFPSCMNKDDWILNFGVGLEFPSALGERDFIWVPPLRLSFDRNVPLGNNLPFFFGGLLTYTGEGWKNIWYTHKISTGFRTGYHFNFDINNFDVYIVATAGWTFFAHSDRRAPNHNRVGQFYWGTNLGARYFISKNFGFWLEAGFNPFSWFDIGISWKF